MVVYHYLIPRFEKDSLSARILLGVQCCEDNNWVLPFFQDPIDSPFINWTSHSYENTTDGPTFIADDPKIPFMETESMWNPGNETWSTGTDLFSNMLAFMTESTSVYTIWQTVDNVSGEGGFGVSLGEQPEMITIDTTKTPGVVVYAPEFYACKHYAHYVKPGAYLVKSVVHGTIANISGSAYLNPNGDVIWVVSSTSANPVTIKVGNEMYKATLPANSFNTLRIVGATVVRQEMQQQYFAASALSNVRIRNLTLYFSLSATVNTRQVDFILTDLQGRAVWTGHRAGSALRGGQQAFAVRSGHGDLPSGTYLLVARIRNLAGAVTTFEKKVAAVN